MKRLVHLVRRFLRSWTSRRPRPGDQAWIAGLLAVRLRKVFWDQPVPDQAHALRGARQLAGHAPGNPDLVRAFLLHDIGKRHARLGTLGRSLATVGSLLHFPVRGRYRTYLDHGRIGAEELRRLGASAMVVSFALHHQFGRPEGFDPGEWELLVAADHA